MAYLDKNGHEVVSDEPKALPVSMKPRSHFDQIREFIRQEVSRQAVAEGKETFEEADDFEVGDDYDPSSPWELSDDQAYYKPSEPPAPEPIGSPEGGLPPEDAPKP